MHSVPNQYDENEDLSVGNTSVLSFNGQHSEHTKRKPDTSITCPPRKKLRTALRKALAHKTPILQRSKRPVNSSSLADEDSDKILQVLDKRPETSADNADASNSQSEPRSKSPKPVSNLMTPLQSSPSALNDSHKNFVTSETGKSERKQKLTPRNEFPETNLLNSDKNEGQVVSRKRKRPKGRLTRRKHFKQNKVENTAKGQPKSKRKKVAAKGKRKTKRKKVTAKGGPKSELKEVVRDFEYEVKERDDDCNILILKI